ncbi:MAG: TrkA family potassium uptake protein [Candidatus Omnitrophica bacterium]|nr:TrkA family potassium uptake protein [Candidatus Omnitrophota bacterium]
MYVIIVGCGRVGSKLAQILSFEGHDVVIIDRQQTAFRRLGESFNGLTLCGNGLNLDFLKAAGIEKAEVFCALTNGDNRNLVAAQIAKKIFRVAKVFARVYDPQRAEIFATVGVSIISGTMLFASMLRDKIMDAKFSTYLVEASDLGVFRMNVPEAFCGKTVAAVTNGNEFSIIAIIRNGVTQLAQPEMVLGKTDVILGLTHRESMESVRKKLNIV